LTLLSDYVVFVDESGDHGLDGINQEYPIFVLSFCVFDKRSYVEMVAPALMRLKFATFGHDLVVLHEHDIRKKAGPFSKFGKDDREGFLNRLTELIDEMPFTLIAVVINKRSLARQYKYPTNPYHLAMEFGLERIYRFLKEKGQAAELTHVIFECRGNKEDHELELEFRRTCGGANYFSNRLPFEVVFADKKSNSCGLQFADMTARPIGLGVLRPDQPNRALAVLERKYYRDGAGRKEGFGLKVFP
jgi:hypothetical protein